VKRRWSLAGAALVALAAAGCEYDAKSVGTGRARPVVHAVLSTAPEVASYVVLVERTLTGRIDTHASVRDPRDPIVSGNGDPVTGARVEITRLDPAVARNAVGVEDAEVRTDRKGAGVYRFVNAECGPFACPANALVIEQGGRYRLRVTLPEGDVIEGETMVPQAGGHVDTIPAATFDRERDTLRLTWPAVVGARRYALQVQTPYGPLQLFSDTNAITLTGGLRNFPVDRIPLVFVPGFEQDVLVAAVDTNYYDYFRSGNDPFTGAGLLTRLRGGIGVFGSWAPIRRGSFEVIAPQDEPIEGTFATVGNVMTIYAIGDAAVSGRFSFSAGGRHGVLGSRTGNRMRLIVLQQAGVNDTLFTARAEVVGDTLVVLADGATAPVRLLRVP
jgi:hypothetical protein